MPDSVIILTVGILARRRDGAVLTCKLSLTRWMTFHFNRSTRRLAKSRFVRVVENFFHISSVLTCSRSLQCSTSETKTISLQWLIKGCRKLHRASRRRRSCCWTILAEMWALNHQRFSMETLSLCRLFLSVSIGRRFPFAVDTSAPFRQ